MVWGVTAVFLLLSACIRQMEVGPTVTEGVSIEPDGAESVQATIRLDAGELLVRGWATHLLDAEFSYNIPEWRPIINYTVVNGQGDLTISQPEYVGSLETLPTGNIHYQWDLRFNNDIPMTLTINLGAGRSDLVLGDLRLSEAQINLGVGETTLDLTGDWRQSATIIIQGGVGGTSVRLPENVGVRVVTATGIGTIDVDGLEREGDAYTNALYGQTDVNLEVSVTGGLGAIRLEME